MTYVNMSLFFSFATLYPDMRVLLYGIIPMKVKWLAWLDVLFFACGPSAPTSPAGQWAMALAPMIAILNYLIFFWEDLARSLNLGREKVRHRTSAQTINFKKAQKEVNRSGGAISTSAPCAASPTRTTPTWSSATAPSATAITATACGISTTTPTCSERPPSLLIQESAPSRWFGWGRSFSSFPAAPSSRWGPGEGASPPGHPLGHADAVHCRADDAPGVASP